MPNQAKLNNNLKEIERLARITMAVILLTAGTSKLFSGGGFFDYYSALFQGDLRIQLPAFLVNSYLQLIPFIEVGLGICLLVNRLRGFALYAWFAFMLSLLVGHYVLQEWSAVNQMLGYFLLGFLCMALPAHQSLFVKPSLSSD